MGMISFFFYSFLFFFLFFPLLFLHFYNLILHSIFSIHDPSPFLTPKTLSLTMSYLQFFSIPHHLLSSIHSTKQSIYYHHFSYLSLTKNSIPHLLLSNTPSLCPYNSYSFLHLQHLIPLPSPLLDPLPGLFYS